MKKKPDIKTRVQVMKVSDLRAAVVAKDHPRYVTDEKINALSKSLREFGNLMPVVYNVTTKHLLGGVQRLKAMERLKESETEVWCVEVPEDREPMVVQLLNTHVGRWDELMLSDMVKRLEKEGKDVSLMLFDEDHLERLKQGRQTPSLESIIEEIPPEKLPEDAVCWLVLRCPESLLAKVKDAIIPILATKEGQFQLETNQ